LGGFLFIIYGFGLWQVIHNEILPTFSAILLLTRFWPTTKFTNLRFLEKEKTARVGDQKKKRKEKVGVGIKLSICM
jgi:hypothetical protein